MNLTGWQGVAIIAIAAALAVVGAFVPSSAGTAGLLALATSLCTGVFALLQASRSPHSRTRAGDRIPTSAHGNPITPPPEPQSPPPRGR